MAVIRPSATVAPAAAQSSARPSRAPARSRAGSKRKKTPGAKKIRNKELPAFTRQLSAMLGA
ncbi:MAG: hypothetical protein JXR37_04075, partial [Kiritimatiellae bacterium]|nr:hypothetical protein [Kiritimatiellia bacterium]